MDNILTVTKTFTAAQINGMFVTPLEVIQAPGSGKMCVPLALTIYSHTTGHTPWAAGDNLHLIAGGSVSCCNTDQQPLIDTDDAMSYSLNTGLSDIAATDIANTAWKLTNDTQAFSGGTGSTLTVFIVYELITL